MTKPLPPRRDPRLELALERILESCIERARLRALRAERLAEAAPAYWTLRRRVTMGTPV